MAVNADKRGVRKYVGIVEAFEYPMYGLQWHPENVSEVVVVVVRAVVVF